MRIFSGLLASFCLILCAACNTPQLYRTDDPSKNGTGSISTEDYQELIAFLENKTGIKAKDTIIIKYDYNNETCWNILDQSEDERIDDVITARSSLVARELSHRKNISVYHFREPGENFNKFILWDETVKTDQDKFLFKLLFKRRSTCGNSMIILPDMRFVRVRSDSHFEALYYSEERVKQALAK